MAKINEVFGDNPADIKKEELIQKLLETPGIDEKSKKQIMLEWSKITGSPVTKEDYDRVLERAIKKEEE